MRLNTFTYGPLSVATCTRMAVRVFGRAPLTRSARWRLDVHLVDLVRPQVEAAADDGTALALLEACKEDPSAVFALVDALMDAGSPLGDELRPLVEGLSARPMRDYDRTWFVGDELGDYGRVELVTRKQVRLVRRYGRVGRFNAPRLAAFVYRGDL